MSDDLAASSEQVNPTHSISAGDISGTGIAVGHGASVTIINQITQGLSDLPTHYDAPVRNFLEYYLGTPEHPAPFGGRQEYLDSLNAWLSEPSAPQYAFLAAPAGRGKSALLVHWIAQLQEHSDVSVAFFPISIRYNTNRENVVFAAWYARLAHLFGERAIQAADVQQYRGLVADYMRRSLADGRRILVVLDGLDEAAGWEIGADLFPTIPQHGLHVLVAARTRAGDIDGRGWLTQLGWEVQGKAWMLSLSELGRDGVRDVLVKMGNPLDALAPKVDLVTRLFELSGGNPLLVRLYVEALLPHGDEAPAFRPEDLDKLEPGLKPYFDLWFRQQELLWGSGSERINREVVDTLLDLCAIALGALTKADLLALAPESFKTSQTLDRAVRMVNRFVIGDGHETTGYVFSHPRLREYFADQLTLNEREAWQLRFLQYGRETLEALDKRILSPNKASTYIVKYYGAHLTQVNAPSSDFYALLCEGWLKAWEWWDGAPDGFLTDARRAWARAEAEGQSAIGKMAQAALCMSSVVSMGVSVASDLIIACLEAGVLNPRMALVLARAKPELTDRIKCLARICVLLPYEDQLAIVTEIQNIARNLANKLLCLETLSEIAAQLRPELQKLILAEALSVARAIGSGDALIVVIKQLSPDFIDLLADVLSAARSVEDDSSSARVLSNLVAHFPLENSILLDSALESVQSIRDEQWRVYALGNVATRLPPSAISTIGSALNIVKSIQDERRRVESLCIVIKRLSPDATRLLVEATNIARGISDKRYFADALSAVAEIMQTADGLDLFAEALAAAHSIQDEGACAQSLCTIAARLPSEERPSVLAEALQVTHLIRDEGDRAKSLCTIAAQVQFEQQQQLLTEALNTIYSIEDEQRRINAWHVLAKHLAQISTTLLTQALQIARTVDDERERDEATDLLTVQHIEDNTHYPTAVDMIEGKTSRVQRLIATIKQLAPDEQKERFAQALADARTIHDEECRAKTLSTVARHLPQEAVNLFAATIMSLNAISNEQDRIICLTDVLSRLPANKHDLFPNILEVGRAFKKSYYRVEALSLCARLLSPEQRETVLAEAFATAQAITDSYERVEAMCIVAGLLPQEEQIAVLSAALSCAGIIARTRYRVIALRLILQRLPVNDDDVLVKALDLARSVEYDDDRANALSAVAEHLSPHERRLVLAEALSAIRSFRVKSERDELLAIIAARLPATATDILAEVLRMISAISDSGYRAEALSEFAKRLLPESTTLLDETIVTARAIQNPRFRAKALSAIAGQLRSGKRSTILFEALKTAYAVEDERDRVDSLLVVAEQLSRDQQFKVLTDALNIAWSIKDEIARTQAVCAVIARLQSDAVSLLAPALATARNVMQDNNHARVLSAICERLPLNASDLWKEMYVQIVAIIHTSASNGRKSLLRALEILAPAIHQLGGEQAIRETAQAIIDTAQWWP